MAELAEERVKPCLTCGTVIPFDAEMCSLCGSSALRRSAADADRDQEEAVKPCLACEALIAADALFCPTCGDFTLSVHGASGSVPPIGAREGGVAAALSRALAVFVLLSGLAMLAGILVDFAAVRELAG